MSGRPPWASSGLFGAGGLLGRSEFADPFGRLDDIMNSFAGFGRPPEQQQEQHRATPRHVSSTAREIPIEGPDDNDEGPGQRPRFTGPVVDELPDVEEHPQLHASLLLHHAVAAPDNVWEPEEEPHHADGSSGHPQHYPAQQTAAKPDPLAAMGTGPPPAMPPRPTMPPPAPPPQQQPPTVRIGGGGGRAGAPTPTAAAAAAAAEEEPGSPMLVDLTDGMGFGAGSPRHIPLPPSAEQHWARDSAGAVRPPPAPQQRQQGQQQPDWLTGDSYQALGRKVPPPPPLPQQRPSAGSPPDAGFFVRTPTAQPTAAAAAPFVQPASTGAPAMSTPALAQSPPPPSPPAQPSVFRSKPAAGPHSAAGGVPAGPSPATSSAAPPAEQQPGRRQRRPSSRLPAMQEAQAAAAAREEEESRRRRSRQQRQASSRRGGELYGSGGEEEGERGADLLPEEDPDWRPGRHSRRAATPPSAAGTPPLPKRSRRSGSAPR